MKKIISCYLNTFFGKDLELRVRLFHVLAITGVVICIAMTWVSLAGENYLSMAINMGTGLVSLGLLIYSTRTGNYRRCYWISILVIFFLLFPSLFFFGGGYRGGMCFFFVFAVVFTVYMLDGKGMLLVSAAELIFYSLLVELAYRRPQSVLTFSTERDVVTDVIIGFVTVSIALGATMLVQVRMYRSQQKELEQARQEAESASLAKSIFLANMSHEIRTPIHVILGLNESIRRESRSHQVRENSRRIGESGKMLLSLVENVLDVAKIESGKMEINPGAYESRELVGTLEVMGRAQCSRKKLQFQTEIDRDLPPVLYGDLPHIRQIASNFLSNAVKYTPRGTVTLRISGEPTGEGLMLCIRVSDTGIGIPPEVQPGIFEAYSRAEGARRIEGTGLGLNIVKKLTDLMGGTVAVESHPGEGSTFSVCLPQGILPEESAESGNQSKLLLAPGARVLVVDDNEGNRMVMQQLLAATRMTVDTADSGKACLELVQRHSYDVILMDYMMPELDGAQTLECLHRLPDFHTPAIVLTADAAPETARLLEQAGFALCLTKPVPWQKLKEGLIRCLDPDKVTLVEDRSRVEQLRDLRGEETLLRPYGIQLSDAMEYFEDFREYCDAGASFLRYDGGEQEKVREFLRDRDCGKLHFTVHAMKGKARSLGMTRLEELCLYAETLCRNGEGEELASLVPYLLYIWSRASEGLRRLLDSRKQEQMPQDSPEDPEIMKQYLEGFERKPALQWIAARCREEPESAGLLEKLQQQVEAFRFDEAMETFTLWRTEREETK